MSVLASAALCAVAGDQLEWITFALFSSHYAVSFYASRQRVVRIVKGESSSDKPVFALLIVAGILVYVFFRPPWIVVFGIHHVLSETYARNGRTLCDREPSRFFFARAQCESFLYLAILRSHPFVAMFAIPRALWLGWGMVAFSLFYFAAISPRIASGAMVRRNDSIASLFVGLTCLGISVFFPITLTHFVVYHVVSWLFLPVRDSRSLPGIMLRHAGAFALFFALTPALRPGLAVHPALLRSGFSAMAFAHVVLSLAVSSANPGWIRLCFELRRPRTLFRLARAD